MVRDERFSSEFGIGVGGLAPILVGALLVPLRDVVSQTTIALVLVVVVVAAAAIGGRAAGMTAAVSAALSFDFFFTRPFLSLTIDSQDDVETTILLLVVGGVVGTIAARGRRAAASVESGRHDLRRIHQVAELAAAGAEVERVIFAAQAELTGLLGLASCRFEAPPYATAMDRLDRSGAIQTRTPRWKPEGFELPAAGVELPVLARGQQVGRFVLVPKPGVGVSLDQRVVAVALADQVGGALRPTERNQRA